EAIREPKMVCNRRQSQCDNRRIQGRKKERQANGTDCQPSAFVLHRHNSFLLKRGPGALPLAGFQGNPAWLTRVGFFNGAVLRVGAGAGLGGVGALVAARRASLCRNNTYDHPPSGGHKGPLPSNLTKTYPCKTLPGGR